MNNHWQHYFERYRYIFNPVIEGCRLILPLTDKEQREETTVSI
jgi:hypothetical protein